MSDRGRDETPMFDAIGVAIAAARWAEALGLATDAWRVTREPALAELVVVLGEVVADEVTHRARALRAPPRFDPAGHPDNPARWYGFHDQLAAIDDAPLDPRTGLALASLVGRPPPWLDARAWNVLCDERVGERLVEHADRRVLAVLAPATTDPQRRTRVMRWIDGIERAADVFPRSTEKKRTLGWVEDARAARRKQRAALDELLAVVHAAPDDLGAREVLADALLEHGDPRGEMMALSLEEGRGVTLDEADRKRLAYLIGEHETEWLGRDVVRYTRNRVWRNGMLEGATLVRDVSLPPTCRITD